MGARPILPESYVCKRLPVKGLEPGSLSINLESNAAVGMRLEASGTPQFPDRDDSLHRNNGILFQQVFA